MARRIEIEPYSGPAGGWGSVRSLAHQARESHNAAQATAVLRKQNKPHGFQCVSCAWAKPEEPHAAEFCENGAKATYWELTGDRATQDFFAEHTVSELRGWSDYELEATGRLTEPMKYDAASDRYLPISWDEAFAEIGAALRRVRAVDPKAAIFYASGRASLETSYMYQLLARLYGNNNLPDSSNMCHESTSVGLKEAIGVPVGTVWLEDFKKTDALFFFGQNVGSNSPRMLHDLQEASERGAAIVSFNPLRELGLERFINPQSPVQMVTQDATRISSECYQLKAGSDIAAITGICKVLIDAHDAGEPDVIDTAFIAEHTQGFEAFADFVRQTTWVAIEAECGLPREAIERSARTYAAAERVIAVYGMGITQHKLGVTSVQMLVNLLLLRGNIGKPGAGICPVRGHSNVQGQRTVGITEKPELAPLDKLAELYDFEPPRDKGMTTVESCEAIIGGTAKAFIGLGGNFLRAVPERELMEKAWPGMELTVQIATKLNRGHLFNGTQGYLLPCLGRIEIDRQAGNPQIVTMEDSTSHFHASRGQVEPIGEKLLSEPAIVAGIAEAALEPNPNVPWQGWVADYGLVRDAIERTYPKIFGRFSERMDQPGGFPKPLAARERKWETESGKAEFNVPRALSASFAMDAEADVLRLMTIRSNDQFNTTVYGYDDRFRGVQGTRMVVFMNGDDMMERGLADREVVGMETAVDDGVSRAMQGFTVVRYNIPRGCVAAYYPECNALIPLWQHAEKSQVPAAKSVPVRVKKAALESAA